MSADKPGHEDYREPRDLAHKDSRDRGRDGDRDSSKDKDRGRSARRYSIAQQLGWRGTVGAVEENEEGA